MKDEKYISTQVLDDNIIRLDGKRYKMTMSTYINSDGLITYLLCETPVTDNADKD